MKGNFFSHTALTNNNRDINLFQIPTIIALIPVLSLAISQRDTDCIAPNPCTCYDRVQYEVFCQFLGLEKLPTFDSGLINYTEVIFHLKSNKIERIENNSFTMLSFPPGTEITVDLSWNAISDINYEAFSGIANYITELYLNFNNLTTISRAFSGMTQLQTLYVSFNPLKMIDPVAMQAFGNSLTYLSIDLVNFIAWPMEIGYLNSLTNLDMFNVPFREIPDNAFETFKDTVLGMSVFGSELVSFPKALCHLNTIGSLAIFSSPMIGIYNGSAVCEHPMLSMQFVDLENNSFQQFPAILEVFPMTSDLDLKDNVITSIDEQAFATANHLENLNLMNNSLTNLPKALKTIPKLKSLFLSNNNITAIDEDVLQNLPALNSLMLNSNGLTVLPEYVFINHKHMYLLALSDNNISSLPRSIMNLTSLSSLYLQDNPIKCSCDDMDYLKTWNTTKMTIFGNCGGRFMPIQTYIQNHLPQCP
ncbi:CPN2-like protein [Mya arenaria]|uniref:CPN2-like protein n=1 Tax=Mya arenaria TaxID=6604 RepID=A0ABY7DSV1_MYAAR|nr:CPN2-like protein [Mya arenaria]